MAAQNLVNISSGNCLSPDGMPCSHYPNECWLFFREAMWYSPMTISMDVLKIPIIRKCCKITHPKLPTYHPWSSNIMYLGYIWSNWENICRHSSAVVVVNIKYQSFTPCKNNSESRCTSLPGWTVHTSRSYLFGAKPLSEIMLKYWQWDHWKQLSMNFESNYNDLHTRNAFEKIFCKIAAILYRHRCVMVHVASYLRLFLQ